MKATYFRGSSVIEVMVASVIILSGFMMFAFLLGRVYSSKNAIEEFEDVLRVRQSRGEIMDEFGGNRLINFSSEEISGVACQKMTVKEIKSEKTTLELYFFGECNYDSLFFK